MTTWANVRSTVTTWVENVTGLPVVWRNTSDQNQWTGIGRVIASVSGGANVGVMDEVVYTEDPDADPGEEILVSVIGRRTYTLGFRIEVFDQTADQDALYYAGIIRVSARAPSVVAALNAVNVGVAGTLLEAPLDEVFERRFVSVAQLDMRINTVEVYADTPVTHIETVKDAEMTAELPDGTDVVRTLDIDLT